MTALPFSVTYREWTRRSPSPGRCSRSPRWARASTTATVLADESFREMLAALDFRATYEPDRSKLKVRATLAPELMPVNGDGMLSPLSVPPAVSEFTG
jgi:hypothetical protein